MVATLTTTLTIFFFGANQLSKLFSYGQDTIMVSSRDNYFGDTDFEFTTDDGLMIAFALSIYDPDGTPRNTLEDLSYGALKAYYMQWDPDVEIDYF